MTRELRVMTSQNEDDILKLPVIVRGRIEAIISYVQAKGWRWKKDQNIFGGYWVDNQGNCYFIT